jgi:hypothetical protein
MGAKKVAAIESAEQQMAADRQRPALRSVIMESLVATEAELNALYEETDRFVGASARIPNKRLGVA